MEPLHPLLVKIASMTPAECRSGGAALSIHYSFAESPFGKILLASTEKGICRLAFADDEEDAFLLLKGMFPSARYARGRDRMQENALSAFKPGAQASGAIEIHLKGTEFQIKVWKALLHIPSGQLISYGNLARTLGVPRAGRAVGNALGANPVALLIPCHRVIRSDGRFGQYHWGSARKAAIIEWERAHTES